jgi:hypothetical protein
LSVMVTDPLIGPVVVGLNVTLIEHCPPLGTLLPQLLVSPKPALGTMLLILSTDVPLFVRVTDWLPLVVPMTWFAKVRLWAERVTTGPCASMVAQHKACRARDLMIFMTILLGDAAGGKFLWASRASIFSCNGGCAEK